MYVSRNPLPITPFGSCLPCAAKTKMATVPEQVKEIAQAAIDSINQLTSLIEHGPTTASGTLRIPSNAHVAEAADGGKRQLTTSETTFVRQTQPANSALAELQRRFPTVSRGRAATNRDPVSGRYRRPSNSTSRPYPVVQNARRSAGRPASEIVSKDVMILNKSSLPLASLESMSNSGTSNTGTSSSLSLGSIKDGSSSN